MAVGLVMLLYWANGLQALVARLPLSASTPASILTSTGVELSALEAALLPEDSP